MCDSKDTPGLGWKGWLDIPASAAATGHGPWTDLSHILSNALPTVPFFPAPRFGRIMSQPQHPMNVTEIQMVVHLGTHVDAPRHFFSDGPAFHDIPLERLHGKGVVWRIEKEDYGVIDVADFERSRPLLGAGDILAIDTGWSRHFCTPKYDRHPNLSVAAAEWLVAHKVKLLAVDFVTPDLAVNRRQSGFDWPVHHVLLSHGVLVCEHVRNLDSLAGCVEFMFMALNVKDSDGAPARVLARNITLE
ncbi:MAG: cyclase family protein [Betaproteobacteria bacterium]